MLKCDICLTEGHFKLRCESGVWACIDCDSKRYSETKIDLYGIHAKVRVGSMMNVSQARLNDMDRRVCIPAKNESGYIVGQRLPNGKISDKAVDLRP